MPALAKPMHEYGAPSSAAGLASDTLSEDNNAGPARQIYSSAPRSQRWQCAAIAPQAQPLHATPRTSMRRPLACQHDTSLRPHEDASNLRGGAPGQRHDSPAPGARRPRRSSQPPLPPPPRGGRAPAAGGGAGAMAGGGGRRRKKPGKRKKKKFLFPRAALVPVSPDE